ncbi:MAG: hypothetical protein ACKOOA_12060, partial [Sediminibacterium sp.]
KLSGQCGRLKCCLNYELDTYLDALQQFPDYSDTLDTESGTAHLIKKDIFKNLMWYVLPNNTKHYPLTIQRVKEIKRLNREGQRVAELEPVEISSGKAREAEPAFVDLVGQISLRTLEKNERRKRDRERQKQQNRPDNRNQQGQGQGGQQRQGGQPSRNRGNQPPNRPRPNRPPSGGNRNDQRPPTN